MRVEALMTMTSSSRQKLRIKTASLKMWSMIVAGKALALLLVCEGFKMLTLSVGGQWVPVRIFVWLELCWMFLCTGLGGIDGVEAALIGSWVVVD